MINAAHSIWTKYGNAARVKISKKIERLKPNGFQYFCNEWLSQQDRLPPIDVVYDAYVSIITSAFGTSDVAEKKMFIIYLSHVLAD